MTAAALMFGAAAFADEGMWMIQDINEALEKNMRARGLKLAANEIYNDEAPGTAVADAVVSIGFYCTGSVISDQASSSRTTIARTRTSPGSALRSIIIWRMGSGQCPMIRRFRLRVRMYIF